MLGKKFKEVIANLEHQIKNKDDLDYAKKQVTELTMSYLNELENLDQKYDSKISKCTEKIEELESSFKEIKKQITHEEEIDVEPINCPYCNSKFLIEYDNSQKDIKCPDCKNIIELEWDNFDDDM